jgi:hypothetical protein
LSGSPAWLHRNRRLLMRYERDDTLHDALLYLGSGAPSSAGNSFTLSHEYF